MKDTICAIATGVSNAGISIIRVSGDEAVSFCDRIYRGRQSLLNVPTHVVSYGHIIDDFSDEKNVIDEVLVTVFRAPKSYTKEDVVEISCHGGILVTEKILNLVLECGARLAEPGEFTKRAFLNGRIDLSQAESVMDIISSDNEKMLRNSIRQLSGALSNTIRNLRDEILHETAFIESALDDPEHYDLESYGSELSIRLSSWQSSINKLISSSKEGVVARDGIKTVIVGKPNAGKSSLLNALAKEDRAIVTDIPGTTRDIIREKVKFGNFILSITDTAGIRESDDIIEKIGVQKSIDAIEDADLILYLVDPSDEFNEDDTNIVSRLDFSKTVLVINKSDKLVDYDTNDCLKFFPDSLKERFVVISAKFNLGFDNLYNNINDMLKAQGINVDSDVDIMVTNSRHLELLRDSSVSLSLVDKSISDGMPEDFYMVDLIAAYSSLGLIIGEETEDDLIDKIFKEFCMGK